jgi:hypothetical protein
LKDALESTEEIIEFTYATDPVEGMTENNVEDEITAPKDLALVLELPLFSSNILWWEDTEQEYQEETELLEWMQDHFTMDDLFTAPTMNNLDSKNRAASIVSLEPTTTQADPTMSPDSTIPADTDDPKGSNNSAHSSKCHTTGLAKSSSMRYIDQNVSFDPGGPNEMDVLVDDPAELLASVTADKCCRAAQLALETAIQLINFDGANAPTGDNATIGDIEDDDNDVEGDGTTIGDVEDDDTAAKFIYYPGALLQNTVPAAPEKVDYYLDIPPRALLRMVSCRHSDDVLHQHHDCTFACPALRV